MKPPPKDWPRMCAGVFCKDAAGMIDWYCKAFGFELRLKVEGDQGQIEHSELTYGGALIFVGPERTRQDAKYPVENKSPQSVGGANTQSLMLYVDEVEPHCEIARAAGATIASEPALHDYGAEYWADRSYGAVDPEGHLWWFTQRVRDPNA